MVVGEASIHNIMGGMESTGGVRLHNHKRKLKQRFDIIKKLGQGTYGKVQLGINKETGQEVAIKTIKKCKIETEADLIRIRREIQIMSSVQHPNIIHIYEVFENREKMVLVMEYAAGGELYDYLSERKVLAEEEARRIFRQISIAVYYCHKHKICHRDLKLENILLDQSGNAKIADFGLSNVFDDHRLLNTFCGSPLYASPEIVKGTPYHGPEVDCWSLGVLLYTLVYGAMPFDGSNFKRLTRQISASDYFEPKIPSPASALIKEMLTKCPSRRADIERICCHWWVNEGYEQNCLDIAEDLAAQTPVRLDLLLSLVPQSASADKLVVGGDPRPEPTVSSLSSDALVTRCHSVGSLMELDRSADDKLRDIVEGMEEERCSAGGGDIKRKLELTPSMEETVSAGTKKKERSRRREKDGEERETRAYRSSSRHHSAPIGAAITEEPMEVDLRDPESADAILEMLKEVQSQSDKERSKTPVAGVIECVGDDKAVGNVLEEILLGEKKLAGDEDKGNEGINRVTGTADIKDESAGGKSNNLESKSQNEEKSLKKKSIPVDSEDIPAVGPVKSTERRKSKIFETAEKFNQLASSASMEPDKAKKIFIPGVNVGGAKKAFERKASLSSINPPAAVKGNTSKVIIDVPVDKRGDKGEEKSVISEGGGKGEGKSEEERKREEEKKRAVDIIAGALGKPPIKKSSNGSPPLTPQTSDPKKLGLKIQVGPNDVRNATVLVTTPIDTKYPDFEIPVKPVPIDHPLPSPESKSLEISPPEEPTMSSKMEITLKSATLPRPRKTSKAEIILSGFKPPFKSEVEAKIDAFHPQKLRTQRSEVAFPVAGVVPQAHRSASLEPENGGKSIKERIIPIQVEPEHQSPPPHAKPPMPQRSMSQRSGSLSRQSTADSDTDSALGSTGGPEPIRKSPREYIIPIAVEGGGYVTPRSGSLEPDSKNSTPTSVNPSRSKFGRPRRMGSLLSDASEDESPFSTLHRDSDDLLQRHMHRLRSSRPSKQPSEHADSLSSGEDDDDDGFELLTAENLFSTLLSRVRSLTQRLNVDDHRGTGFPRSRLLERLGSNSSQGFWGLHEPLSRRMTETPFRSSISRDTDRFVRKDSAVSSNPGTPNSLGRSTPSRESMFDTGSNTLPRDKCEEMDLDLKMIKEIQEDQEDDKKFTPSLARRLSRQFIEKTRLSLPRSPSIPRERLLRSSTEEPTSLTDPLELSLLPEPSYRSRSSDRSLRRAASLLESTEKSERSNPRTSRRSVSLFEDNDELLPPLPRQVMTLGRKYREQTKSPINGNRRESFQTQKIQEEPMDLMSGPKKPENPTDLSEESSTINMPDISNCSNKSGEISPTDSNSKIQEDSFNSFKAHAKEFENRLLAAENLIKESKLRNLGISKFDPNLSSSYRDTDKCDKEMLGSMSDLTTSVLSKRKSCIPSLRLRSGSLTREVSAGRESRRETVGDDGVGSVIPERSLLSKLFRSSSSTRESEGSKSPKVRRKMSRFLRPDFFDTPREESQYVKEKEAQRVAENERRRSRFLRRKMEAEGSNGDEKQEKELKNEANTLTKEKVFGKNEEIKGDGAHSERQSPKNSFLQSLERKLERLRSNDDGKLTNGSPEKEVVKDLTGEGESIDILRSPEPLRKVSSAEDLPLEVQCPPVAPTAKSKVSSVLGLFKNDSKSSVNGSKGQNTLLSKFRKNTYKGSRSDTSVITGDTSSSKIPTKSKLDSKSNSKVLKTNLERKKSIDKIVESKKSPPKDKSKEISPIKDKIKEKTPSERSSVERKSLVDKSMVKSPKKLSPEKSIDSKSDKCEKSLTELKKSQTSDKFDNKNYSTVRLSSPKKISPDKTLDNKKADSKISEGDGKNIVKKKTVKSSTTASSKNGSVSKIDKSEDDKVKKVIIKKEIIEREGEDGTKKKRIVRVVKKVVKKSESCSDKNKEKPLKSLSLKKMGLRKEKSPDDALKNNEMKPEPSLESNYAGNSGNPRDKIGEKNSPEKSEDITSRLSGDYQEENSQKIVEETQINSSPSILQQDFPVIEVKSRVNRSNLKLDLSKVPQHSFKPPSGIKRDSPRSEPAVMTQETSHNPQIPENQSIPSSDLMNEQRKVTSEVSPEFQRLKSDQKRDIVPSETKTKTPTSSLIRPKILTEHSEDILSPTDDGESFDSWSICSNDLNHRSSDFHSPTSPTYCPPGRDHSESIIDRIRRKSFYSRFNERKRKTSLTSPSISSVSPLPSSSTLPRKFSFNSAKDSDRIKSSLSGNSRRRHAERPVTMYNDDHGRFRKSSIERDRYSDVGSYSGDFDHLRRYRISPTPDFTHRKYQSSDLNFDHDVGMYKSPFNSSTLSDPLSDYRSVSRSLPRKYGGVELKTPEYYEELLAPSRMEYLTRRTPVPGESSSKNENGYTNGHVEIGDKWRSFSEKVGGGESTDESDKSLGDDRGNSKSTIEVKELSAACPDAEATNSIIE